MSDTKELWELGKLRGELDERDRIVYLLETQLYDSTIKGLSWIPDGSELTKKDLIALIKGEQK